MIQAPLGWHRVGPRHLPETKKQARLVTSSNGYMILYLSAMETFILRDPKCSCFIASRTVMHGVQIILHLCFFSFLFFLFVGVIYLFESEHGQGWDRGRSRFPAEQGA